MDIFFVPAAWQFVSQGGALPNFFKGSQTEILTFNNYLLQTM
jgi:hypothetical protein